MAFPPRAQPSEGQTALYNRRRYSHTHFSRTHETSYTEPLLTQPPQVPNEAEPQTGHDFYAVPYRHRPGDQPHAVPVKIPVHLIPAAVVERLLAQSDSPDSSAPSPPPPPYSPPASPVRGRTRTRQPRPRRSRVRRLFRRSGFSVERRQEPPPAFIPTDGEHTDGHPTQTRKTSDRQRPAQTAGRLTPEAWALELTRGTMRTPVSVVILQRLQVPGSTSQRYPPGRGTVLYPLREVHPNGGTAAHAPSTMGF